ncbi:MAG TPA: DUF1957 domain-containing protein [Defluviitoga sp.]|nr:DUF1957 domain-containing protein [Defluviitoga sp.]HOP23818.1 DUF1957 domain-containing protein [Defluviitoga sp.]HPZ28435.1 DUF1957 domain-containing protein [Defluviitoga sp.]HQD62831.1 DUF1957 domain-containing protein [Defluviitoga sp.]
MFQIKGNLLLVLHAHLPYIHHPDFEEFLEERWLFEAITETYIPLIKVFKSLEKDQIPFKLTISFSPPLIEMLTSNSLQAKYLKHLSKLIELSEKEVQRTKNENWKKWQTAIHYRQEFIDAMEIYYDQYSQNILKAFKEFQDKGYIEVITCNGTHSYLPFYKEYPEAIRAQLKVAISTFEKNFGKRPRGMWSAECAYFDGLDKYFREEKIEYFFVDSHAFLYASPPPRYGVYRPVITPNGVFVFARDPESSEQIWSSEVGYPGDPRYREFYKDIGFEREEEYIKPYIDKSGTRCNTGIKYYRVTDKSLPLDKKELYDLKEAKETVKEHSKDFILKKMSQVERLTSGLENQIPIIVAPFDAELFGHWWYEGPMFLEQLFRILAENDYLETHTPSEILDTIENVQIVTPAESSWGAQGYHDVWLNFSNSWIYRHIYEITERMIWWANTFENPSTLERRILNQMAREVLLVQSSDWPFIMTTNTTVEYAKMKINNCVNRFLELEKMLKEGKINEQKLRYYEWVDGIFKDLDYQIFSSNY